MEISIDTSDFEEKLQRVIEEKPRSLKYYLNKSSKVLQDKIRKAYPNNTGRLRKGLKDLPAKVNSFEAKKEITNKTGHYHLVERGHRQVVARNIRNKSRGLSRFTGKTRVLFLDKGYRVSRGGVGDYKSGSFVPGRYYLKNVSEGYAYDFHRDMEEAVEKIYKKMR